MGIIGRLYTVTGMTEIIDDMEVPIMSAIDGWHVNVRLVDGENSQPIELYAVTPSTPSRIWG